MESEILYENLAGESCHRHESQAVEPFAQGVVVGVLALLSDRDAEHEYLTDGEPFVEDMTDDAEDGEQQLAVDGAGVLVVEDVLQLVVEHGVRQVVGAQELVFLVVEVV